MITLTSSIILFADVNCRSTPSALSSFLRTINLVIPKRTLLVVKHKYIL